LRKNEFERIANEMKEFQERMEEESVQKYKENHNEEK